MGCLRRRIGKPVWEAKVSTHVVGFLLPLQRRLKQTKMNYLRFLLGIAIISFFLSFFRESLYGLFANWSTAEEIGSHVFALIILGFGAYGYYITWKKTLGYKETKVTS
jgi:hypothetical protein